MDVQDHYYAYLSSNETAALFIIKNAMFNIVIKKNMYLQVRRAKILGKRETTHNVWKKQSYIARYPTIAEENNCDSRNMTVWSGRSHPRRETLEIQKARERFSKLKEELRDAKQNIQTLQRQHSSLRASSWQYKPRQSGFPTTTTVGRTVAHWALSGQERKCRHHVTNHNHSDLNGSIDGKLQRKNMNSCDFTDNPGSPPDISNNDLVAISSKVIEERKQHWRNVTLPHLQKHTEWNSRQRPVIRYRRPSVVPEPADQIPRVVIRQCPEIKNHYNIMDNLDMHMYNP